MDEPAVRGLIIDARRAFEKYRGFVSEQLAHAVRKVRQLDEKELELFRHISETEGDADSKAKNLLSSAAEQALREETTYIR